MRPGTVLLMEQLNYTVDQYHVAAGLPNPDGTITIVNHNVPGHTDVFTPQDAIDHGYPGSVGNDPVIPRGNLMTVTRKSTIP